MYNFYLKGEIVNNESADKLALGKDLQFDFENGDLVITISGEPEYVYLFTVGKVLNPIDKDVDVFQFYGVNTVKLHRNSSTLLYLESEEFKKINIMYLDENVYSCV